MSGHWYASREYWHHVHPLSSLLSDSGDTVATLRGHEASVKSLSVHQSGQFMLSISSSDSMLWQLRPSYSHLRTLNGGETVGVQDVSMASNTSFHPTLSLSPILTGLLCAAEQHHSHLFQRRLHPWLGGRHPGVQIPPPLPLRARPSLQDIHNHI